jgi:acyl carrier protein
MIKKKKILDQIQPLFRKVFKNNTLKINFKSSASNIKNWDSLIQIILVVEIEKMFKIKFSVSELSNVQNVGEFIDIIIKKNK